MKILLFGSNSTVGKEIQKFALENFPNVEIIPITREICDLLDQKQLMTTVTEINYDVLVNCAALTDLDLCESNKELAYETNVLVPQRLSHWNSMKNLPMIQISSATVFGDEIGEVKTVKDNCHPKSTYSLTKFEAENKVLYHPNHYAIRTSWVYNDEIKNPKFIGKIVSKLLSNDCPDSLTVTTQKGCLTYAPDLAKFIIQTSVALHLNDKKVLDFLHNDNNIVHFTDKGFTSRDVIASFIVGYLMQESVLTKSVDIISNEDYDKKRNVHELMKSISYNSWESNLEKCLNNMIKERKNELLYKLDNYDNMFKVGFSSLFDSDGAY